MWLIGLIRGSNLDIEKAIQTTGILFCDLSIPNYSSIYGMDPRHA